MINRQVRVDYIGNDRTTAATQAVTRNLDNVHSRVTRVSRSAIAMQRVFAGLTLGFAGNNAVRTLGDLQDNLTRIKNLSSNYARDQEFLTKATRDLNLELQGASSNYAQLLVLQNTGLIGQDQARKLFTGLQEAAARFGTSAGDIDLAIRGIRQALTQGTLRAQEFDQIFDAIGAAQPKVAKQLGLTTREFQQLRTSNSLAADTFVNALIPALLEFEGSAAKASKNINASLRRMSTSYKEALLEFEQPISGGINEFTDAGIASIDTFVEHADKLETVGKAVAAVYGARALSSVAAFTQRNYTAVASTVAHSQALVTNNKLIADKARQTLRVAQAEQASLAAQNQTLTALKNQTQSRTAANNIEAQLTRNRALLATSTNALVSANAKATAATRALTTAQQGATVKAFALAGANRALSGSLALVGGPAGAAILAGGAVAYMATRQSDAQKITKELQETTANLNEEYARTGQISRDNVDQKIREAEAEILLLQARRQAFEFKGGPAGAQAASEQATDRITAQVRKLQSEIKNLRLGLNLVEDARATSDEFEQLDQTATKLRNNLSRFDGNTFVSKYLKDSQRLIKLREDLAAARSGFASDDAQGQAVIAAIQKEIGSLTGAEKAAQRYTQQIEKARNSLTSLSTSLQSERERIAQTFKSAEATVALNVELNTIDVGQAVTVLAKARERMEQELDAINTRELEAQQEAQRQRDRLHADQLAKQQQHIQRMIAARSVIDPRQGEAERFQQEVSQLNTERDKGLVSQRDHYTLVQAAYRRHVEVMAGIAVGEVATERKKWADLTAIQQTQLVTQYANGYLQAAQKNVGSYIEITDQMTDSEKQNAKRQNAINRKRLRDNQRYQLKQVAINTAAAIMKAYSTYEFIPATGMALALAATGQQQARNIRSGTLSGSSVSTGGAGGSGTEGNQSAIETAQNTRQAPQLIVLGMNPFTNQQQQREQVLRHIEESVENDELGLDKDSAGELRKLVVNL